MALKISYDKFYKNYATITQRIKEIAKLIFNIKYGLKLDGVQIDIKYLGPKDIYVCYGHIDALKDANIPIEYLYLSDKEIIHIEEELFKCSKS